MVLNADAGGVVTFPGKLLHGGNAVTEGRRYIIPLFIYLDVNKLSGKRRGWLLEEAGVASAPLQGLDAHDAPPVLHAAA